MTTKKIKTSDILGNSYYTYELSSSNYTPALNGTITITCTCKNVYGNAVGSKSLTLYQNGTSKGSQTTNNNGVATWSITCSTAGLQKFNIEDTSIEVFVDDKANLSDIPTTASDIQSGFDDSTMKTANLVGIISGNLTQYNFNASVNEDINDLWDSFDNVESLSNKVTNWNNTPSNIYYPSEKLVKDSLDEKLGITPNVTYVTATGNNDEILCIASSDGKIHRTQAIKSNWVKEPIAHTGTGGIGSASNAGQLTINTNINTRLVDLTANKVNTSDIADNLTTNDSTQVLSAKQGKILNDLIGQAISYINQ